VRGGRREPPRSRRGRFVVLEGLSGAGKSTVAEALAVTLPACTVVAAITPEIEPLRAAADRRSVQARMRFWLAVHYGLRRRLEPLLNDGVDVVLDSYVYRTLATHGALGADPVPTVDWDAALVPDLAVHLLVAEKERRRRLRVRDGARPKSPWHAAMEARTADILRRYARFGLREVDTTGITVAEVVTRILALLPT
jgi:thymidylate kinase